ncbi:MAG: hypothetical protein LUI04_06035 [Porphyromonadaceae bacterium]|nr:hypothetical protein [Porphyromonadaceae bacterium]
MGGRGALQGNRIPEEKRRYRNESPKGVKEIDGVKIIRSLDTPNARIPIVSNTPDTRYIISDAKGRIHYIAEYKDNRIVRSVDIKENGSYHQHVSWNEGERRKHGGTDVPDDSPLKPLADKCVEYNKKYFGLKESRKKKDRR